MTTKMTQTQLSKKYGIDQGTVSACLVKVPYEMKVFEGTNRAVRVYDEFNAVFAMYKHYDAACARAIKRAEDTYGKKAEELDKVLDALAE